MRIHVQNTGNDDLFTLTRQQWDEACARAGEAGHDVSFGETAEDARAALREAEAVVAQTGAVKLLFPAGSTPDVPHLKLLFCTSAGLDRLLPLDWLPPGVALLNNRGTHGAKAGEYALMALLMLSNRMAAFATAQREQRWAKEFGSVLAGRQLVVVGLGALGGGAAGHARRFGMHVTGVRTTPAPHPDCDRVVAVDQLDAVLPEADYVMLATPLTEATHNLLDRRRIGLLPRDAGVVNIGRGALLDQDALCDALDAGRLRGAVLDVFVPEPVPPGHRLWTTRNLVMSPHASADDPDTYNPVSLDIFFRNLAAWRRGEALPNRFDPARGW